jgi:hypothetical protein
MKKVLISESKLRAMVRKMLFEMDGMSTGVGTTGFQQPQGQQTQQPKMSPAAQSVIDIINGPSGNTPLANKLKSITNPNDLTAIISFITSKTSLKGNNTASVGKNIASNIKNVQTQAKV